MLHEINPQGRFSSRVENYAKYRPGYPDEVIDFLQAELEDNSESVIADIGGGTGISSLRSRARGINTIAIEPNEAMR